MKAVVLGYASLVKRVSRLAGRSGQGQQSAPSPTVDTLQAEIYELERSLAKAPTRPIRAIRRNSQPLEPITEHQKLVDLAG
jgi:hypothetical protein